MFLKNRNNFVYLLKNKNVMQVIIEMNEYNDLLKFKALFDELSSKKTVVSNLSKYSYTGHGCVKHDVTDLHIFN